MSRSRIVLAFTLTTLTAILILFCSSVAANDSKAPPLQSPSAVQDTICDCIPADSNGDGVVNIGDAVYTINTVFKQGPQAVPYAVCNCDCNGDCICNVGDAVCIIAKVFQYWPNIYVGSCENWRDRCGELR